MKEVKRFRHEPAFMVPDKDGDYVLAVDYLICELELKDFQWGASVEADAGDEARAEVASLKSENESLRADAERYRKLQRYMGSNVKEGWQEVEMLGGVCAWMSFEDMDACLDSLPVCNVGLCQINDSPENN